MAEITTTTTTSAAVTATKKKAPGLTFNRFFTTAGVSPYDELEWELRTAQITDSQGGIIFEQKDVEVPKDWSMTATNIVASKYLHGPLGTPERESGVRALVTRVAETIRDWGIAGGYFRTAEDAAIFHDELAHLLLQQKAAFNSPVWFNVGCDRIEPNSDARNWHWNPQAQRVEYGVTGYRTPQCSACFINSVHDSLDSILTLAKTEGMLFKWGSGTGTNLSPLRSSTESLSGGGTACGPLSFMKGFDAFAGVIKSRRQDAPRRQDGHPQRRPSRHHGVHRVQAEGRSQGLGAHRDGLRRQRSRQRCLLVHLLPERQQLGARDRRLHVRGAARQRILHPRGEGRPSGRDLQGPRPDAARFPTPPGIAAIPACSTTPRSIAGTPRRTPRASTRRIPAASTCSSTTRPATWPAST